MQGYRFEGLIMKQFDLLNIFLTDRVHFGIVNDHYDNRINLNISVKTDETFYSVIKQEITLDDLRELKDNIFILNRYINEILGEDDETNS